MITSIPKTIQTALEHHQAGRLPQAEAIYRQILQVAPNHPDALHFLGMIAYHAEQNGDAAELIGRSVRIKPSGLAYCNLGLALYAQGKFDAAVESYRNSLRLDPSDAVTHYNHGLSLHALGRPEAAVESYRKAISLRANYAEAHSNLGRALQVLGKLDAAIESYRAAISIRSDYVEAHLNLGNALKDQGKTDEAAECYRRAISFKPGYVEAHNNLGSLLKEQGKLDEATDCYRKALILQPGFAEAHYNLGNILKEQGNMGEAAECYQRALSFKPDYALAYSNLIYLHAFTRDIPPESECNLAANWETIILSASERAAARNRALSLDGSFPYPPRTGRKLRVGVVSAELGQHAVAEFLEPFLEQLDRNRFHLSLYPSVVRSGPRAAHFRELADEYKPVAGISDSKSADLIRSDRIDILMDTTGHMNSFRLGIFAHRAAPVQCHYIGYHGTTGLTEMDWFIADEVLLPPSYDAHFREGIWRLPRLWIAYRGDVSLPESRWQPDEGGIVRLGSFNNLTKINGQTLDLWARVMNALPQSKLLLKDIRAADPQIRQRILSSLSRHGIAGERVEFAPWAAGWDSHMAMYDRLDIALDAIPLNSGTTAFDALWMGVPLIALEGNWMGGRMTGAMLGALGRPEWVAKNEDEYVAIVTALARDVEGRKALRATQRPLMAGSQLCDAIGLARALETAFEKMFDLWLAKREAAAKPPGKISS